MDVKLYSNTVLRAAIGIAQHKSGREIGLEYERAVRDVSDYFFELSEVRDIWFLSEELTLTEFYWPSDNFPENLKGKTLDDFRLHSWLFAKNLSTFKETSNNQQKDLIHICCDLHTILLAERSSKYGMGLAA